MENRLNKEIKKLFVASSISILISIIGICFDKNFIHPAIYILSFFMGLGWGATAIAALIENKNKKE